jgi:hypothetical protein
MQCPHALLGKAPLAVIVHGRVRAASTYRFEATFLQTIDLNI